MLLCVGSYKGTLYIEADVLHQLIDTEVLRPFLVSIALLIFKAFAPHYGGLTRPPAARIIRLRNACPGYAF